MKRTVLIRELEQAGCTLLRHGGKHDIYHQPLTGRAQPVPRHREINEVLAQKEANPPEQGPPADVWRKAVRRTCLQAQPARPPTAESEFLDRRVRWVELLPERWLRPVPLFQRLLALLLQPEEQLPGNSRQLRQEAAGSALEPDFDDVIAAILIARFPSRSIPEVCAMGGITVEDFTQSRIYQEIAGIGRREGRLEGRQEGRLEGEATVTLRLLSRRCGTLSPAITARIEALPLEQLEALAEALLDFQGPDDLDAWLAANG